MSLYSDVPAIALHEAGHAKDFADVKYKGTYAFFGAIPFASLYYEKEATGDVIGYLRETGMAHDEKQAYHILYPAYVTYIGGSLAQYTFLRDIIYPIVVIPGHIAGRFKARTVKERPEDASVRVLK